MHDSSRPHADKTDEQLATLSDGLARQREDLARQHAAIELELLLRGHAPPNAAPESAGPIHVIPYMTPATSIGRNLITGDSYTDAARGYALRVTAIAFAVVIAGVFMTYLAWLWMAT